MSASGVGVLKVNGRIMTAPRVAWELARGEMAPGMKVSPCPEVKACVRVDHLVMTGRPKPRPTRRAPKGGGSITKLREGAYKLTVPAGRYDDGKPRRESRTVYVDTRDDAVRELAAFVTEVANTRLPSSEAERDMTLDAAVTQYLTEHLLGEKGRAQVTVDGYQQLHNQWFSPQLGQRRARDITDADMDRMAGKMRSAGLSASRLADVRNLYRPLFRWAKRRGIVLRNPMAEFEIPTSSHVAQEHMPPEVEELVLYLNAAVEVIPAEAPILTLAAITGCRRGELVSLRRSDIFPKKLLIKVEVATDGKKVTPTKTRKTRDVSVDAETMAMLLRHCQLMDDRAAREDVAIAADAFVFSLVPDCSVPLPPDHFTKQVARLKDYLGITNKRPETIELEDKALKLRRTAVKREKGRPGPRPETGGMSYEEIGKCLGRTNTWARKAVKAAELREEAAARGEIEWFDGSILAMRRFTSTELLDNGFSIKMVAQRQGHRSEVLMKHYARPRRGADRSAAEHLGRVIHTNGRKSTRNPKPTERHRNESTALQQDQELVGVGGGQDR